MIVRAIQLALYTFPVFVGVAVFFTSGENWERTNWSWETWGLISLISILVGFLAGITKRAYQLEKDQAPKINVDWRFDSPFAELVVTNQSSKTITGIDVMFRNYRQADGSNITSVLKSLTSNDGKNAPISLNPLVQTYFRFAQLKKNADPTEDEQTAEGVISILAGSDGERWLTKEAGIKLGISGNDIANSRVDLRLTVNSDELLIEPWERGGKAVGLGDSDL